MKRNNHTDEEVAMAMLYRRHVGFAIGHGISVHAETLPGDSTRAVRLSACVVPTYDVPRTESPTPIEIPGLEGLVLDMKKLAETPIEKISRTLMPLVTAYEDWIAQQTTRIDDPDSDLAEYRSVAIQSMQECRRTLERIRDGIALLKQNERAAKAFAFMNEAMWQQRIHTLCRTKTPWAAYHPGGHRQTRESKLATVPVSLYFAEPVCVDGSASSRSQCRRECYCRFAMVSHWRR